MPKLVERGVLSGPAESVKVELTPSSAAHPFDAACTDSTGKVVRVEVKATLKQSVLRCGKVLVTAGAPQKAFENRYVLLYGLLSDDWQRVQTVYGFLCEEHGGQGLRRLAEYALNAECIEGRGEGHKSYFEVKEAAFADMADFVLEVEHATSSAYAGMLHH
jgi:hypothetical protein